MKQSIYIRRFHLGSKSYTISWQILWIKWAFIGHISTQVTGSFCHLPSEQYSLHSHDFFLSCFQFKFGSGVLALGWICSLCFKMHFWYILKYQKKSNWKFMCTPSHATCAQNLSMKNQLVFWAMQKDKIWW
jgi:hypothetical protein